MDHPELASVIHLLRDYKKLNTRCHNLRSPPPPPPIFILFYLFPIYIVAVKIINLMLHIDH